VALLIGLALVVVVAVWLARPSPAVPPGDDIHPVDEQALAEAEQELQDGAGGATLEESERDDWGPGTGGGPGRD